MTETLRVVQPPLITGGPPTAGQLMPVASRGERSKEALLLPLTMRERVLVCAIVDVLRALQPRAERDGGLEVYEKRALLGLMVAFETATGCTYTDARWDA